MIVVVVVMMKVTMVMTMVMMVMIVKLHELSGHLNPLVDGVLSVSTFIDHHI